MEKKDSKNRIPKLRFPGCIGKWTKEIKLGEIIDVCKGQQVNNSELTNDSTKYPMLNGGTTISGYYFQYNAPANTITISEGGNSCGYVNYMKENFWAGGHCYIVKPVVDIDKDFLFYLLKHKESDIMKLRVGSGLPNIQRKSLLQGIIISLAEDPVEQQKIAECLSEMDNLIANQEEKVESLKIFKRGLMQQLFPKHGETVPRMRFPGFTGEWEEKKLRDVAKKVNRRNKKLEVTRILTNSANSGIVDQADYFERSIAVKDNTSNYHIVEIDEFAYNPRISSAAPVGPVSINKIGRGIMSPLYTIFKFNDGCIEFYYYYFQTTLWHTYLKSIANFGARFDRMNITTEDFFNMPLVLPSLQEQQKIAECLSTLDATIEAETNKLESLKTHKKGLMQQLFPQPTK